MARKRERERDGVASRDLHLRFSVSVELGAGDSCSVLAYQSHECRLLDATLPLGSFRSFINFRNKYILRPRLFTYLIFHP